MSKYFLYGTRLSEFEQLMMLVPNVTPRKTGLIILENLETETNQIQDNVGYKKTVRSSFLNLHDYDLNKRLQTLIKRWNGKWFLSEGHKQRFMERNISHNSKRIGAVIYLLAADEDLWRRSCHLISVDRIDLSKIQLQGIGIDCYALYKTAKMIATGKAYIHLDEIVDEQLIDNFLFQAIIHSILIAKNGTNILKQI